MSFGNRIYIDVETTGLSKSDDQILELAAIAEDPSGRELERLHLKVKLKANIIPSPYALFKNNLNPYSDSWKKEAVTENEAAKAFAAFAERHKVGKINGYFTAYKAEFDGERIAVMFSRNGFQFFDYFNRSVYDPIITARQLIKAGKIKTKFNAYGNGGSARLEDVADALQVSRRGNFHRAMIDVEVMRDVTKDLFKLATGEDPSKIRCSPESYKPGDVVKVVTDSRQNGLKIRHLKILDNNPDVQKLIALDEDDLKKNSSDSMSPTAVRYFNYGTLIYQMDVDVQSRKFLEDTYYSNFDHIAGLVESGKQAYVSPALKDDPWSPAVNNFELISKVEALLSKTTVEDKKAVYETLVRDISSKIDDPTAVALILSRAEELALAKGLPGWSKLFGRDKERLRVPDYKITIAGKLVRIECHPRGEYHVSIEGIKTDRVFLKKNDLFKYLTKALIVDPEDSGIKNLAKWLSSPSDFKNIKHPYVIKDDIVKLCAEIAQSGCPVETLDAVEKCIAHWQAEFPEVFKDSPNPREAYVSWQTRTATFVTQKEIKTESDNLFIPSAIVSFGEKIKSKVVCKRCGRPFTPKATDSEFCDVGPICRQSG